MLAAFLILTAGTLPADGLSLAQDSLTYQVDRVLPYGQYVVTPNSYQSSGHELKVGDVLTLNGKKSSADTSDNYATALARATRENRDLVVWVGGADCPPCVAATPNAVHVKVTGRFGDRIHGFLEHGVMIGRRNKNRPEGFDRYDLADDFSLNAIQRTLAVPVTTNVAACAGGCAGCSNGTCSVAGACGMAGCGSPVAGYAVPSQTFYAVPQPSFSNGGGGCMNGNCGGTPSRGRFR